ncbi:hypothetical protein AaE_013202 [Aphanomyces astaci]|uniref:Uncharacterized protein n=1 Tax=Aphanomyces astaci TaxID=112090 RepID=A0A6A4Z6A2_APHAT|nr:hypothetical protein AaE_013202 [Aphanomyces astaci]
MQPPINKCNELKALTHDLKPIPKKSDRFDAMHRPPRDLVRTHPRRLAPAEAALTQPPMSKPSPDQQASPLIIPAVLPPSVSPVVDAALPESAMVTPYSRKGDSENAPKPAKSSDPPLEDKSEAPRAMRKRKTAIAPPDLTDDGIAASGLKSSKATGVKRRPSTTTQGRNSVPDHPRKKADGLKGVQHAT